MSVNQLITFEGEQIQLPKGFKWSVHRQVTTSGIQPMTSHKFEDFDQCVHKWQDGNFHLLLVVDTDDAEEMQTAGAINDRLVRRAISMGGTSTGEHGIGYGKLEYMPLEHGASLDVMRALKQTLDPDNIMNPGKVIP